MRGGGVEEGDGEVEIVGVTVGGATEDVDGTGRVTVVGGVTTRGQEKLTKMHMSIFRSQCKKVTWATHSVVTVVKWRTPVSRYVPSVTLLGVAKEIHQGAGKSSTCD